MVPDAEVLKVATEILDKLEIGPYEIKVTFSYSFLFRGYAVLMKKHVD
jgi:histidyl-tRNA synthetase